MGNLANINFDMDKPVPGSDKIIEYLNSTEEKDEDVLIEETLKLLKTSLKVPNDDDINLISELRETAKILIDMKLKGEILQPEYVFQAMLLLRARESQKE